MRLGRARGLFGRVRGYRGHTAAVTLTLLLLAASLATSDTLSAPNPRLSSLGPNTALDLGRYQCSQPPDAPQDCGTITDYSRFIYDPSSRQMLMFGGGYAATYRSDVDAFDPATLSWKSAYPSTSCSAMRLANIDRDNGTWRSTGHPIARHTYDMLVVVDRPARLLLLNSVTGQGRCTEAPPSGAVNPYTMDGRIAIYDPAGKRWTVSGTSAAGWEPTAAAEWDPVSRKVIVIDSHFLWTYDPATQQKVRHLEHTAAVSYAKNLVYFPPNGKMYYIADGDAVFEVTLDRKDFSKSTISRVPGITGDIPRLRETGFAYDPVHKMIGGGVRDSVFYAYSPLGRTWLSRPVEASPPGAVVGTLAFHALDYDPVADVFLLLTDLQSGQHTWAFRFSDAHGANVRASREPVPPWPGPSICPTGSLLPVGPSRRLLLPSWAARCAKDGDAVEIDAGTYEGDAAVWSQNNLTLRGVGGRPHLKADGADAEGKAIWVIRGRNTTVENLEFSGAAVPDGNGAAIRLEGANLIVRHSYFHHNENGILTGESPDSEILIEHSEFSYHGSPDGRTHNLYIGAVKRFTLRHSYVHHAKIGHNVKSRARENFILYNRIMDEVDGNSSYDVDLSNGGFVCVVGNVIQHGARSVNGAIIAYGAEGLRYPENEIYVVNNTIVNDRSSGIFVQINGHPSTVRLLNNILAGPGTPLAGTGDLRNNLISRDPGLRDRTSFDYRLTATSPAIDAGTEPGNAHGVGLSPISEYVHKAGGQPRRAAGPIDIGAYEYHRPN